MSLPHHRKKSKFERFAVPVYVMATTNTVVATAFATGLCAGWLLSALFKAAFPKILYFLFIQSLRLIFRGQLRVRSLFRLPIALQSHLGLFSKKARRRLFTLTHTDSRLVRSRCFSTTLIVTSIYSRSADYSTEDSPSPPQAAHAHRPPITEECKMVLVVRQDLKMGAGKVTLVDSFSPSRPPSRPPSHLPNS